MLRKIGAILKAHFKIGLFIFVISLLLMFVVSLFTTKVYQSYASIYIQKKVPTMDESSATSSMFIGTDMADYVKILQSNLVLENVAKRLENRFPKRAVNKSMIASKLRVTTNKNTRVIEFTYQDKDPLFAKEVISETLKEYENVFRLIARETKSKTLDLLKQRVANAQQERQAIEEQIKQYQSEIGVTDFETKNERTMMLSMDYSEKIDNLNGQIVATEKEMEQLNQILELQPDDIKKLSRIRENPQIAAWQQELIKEQTELGALKTVYTDKYTGVIEKKRAIEDLKGLINQRAQEISGQPVETDSMPAYSDMDKTLSQQLMEQSVKYLGLISEKEHYEELMAQFPEQFSQISSQGKILAELKYRASVLRDEIRTMSTVLANKNLEEDVLENVKSFTLITSPVLPEKSDYIFPLKPQTAFTYGLFASVLLSLFSVGLVEYLNPRVIDLGALPILAEMRSRTRKRINENALSNAYQNLALMIHKMQLRTITILHLCGSSSGDDSSAQCPYSPGIFANQLAIMFAKRGVKTLLLECSGNCCDEGDFPNLEQIGTYGEHILCQDKNVHNLHLLCPADRENSFFDPLILRIIPEYEHYDLVLLNISLSNQGMADNLLCELSDATVFGVSESKTESHALRNFQQIASNQQVKLLGSIIFP